MEDELSKNARIKSEEELKMDALNKAESSPYLLLFHRMCTILGYSMMLFIAVAVYCRLISFVDLTDSTYSNGVPKVLYISL